MTGDLLICGTRSFAEEVLDLATEVPGWRVIGFVENSDPTRAGETIEGLPIHWVEDLEARPELWAICALVTTRRSLFTGQIGSIGLPFATLVHPTARLSPRSRIGEGTLVSAGVLTGTRVEIGRHVILNRGALIGHHTRIGDYASVLPGANIAGNSRIGDAAFVGMGAVVLDGLAVGERSIVAAGSVVTRDVPAGVQVRGIPARIVAEAPEGR